MCKKWIRTDEFADEKEADEFIAKERGFEDGKAPPNVPLLKTSKRRVNGVLTKYYTLLIAGMDFRHEIKFKAEIYLTQVLFYSYLDA